eukprot:TRINITY_DN8362_c3_g1_i1.p1 TRINITY_DN8362_c3_g1~~TRINITY_DN8362_c3_g1_i1.p1  ORF type:complete len:1276 (+),score=225.08 TRINITY_DN8362_c3_g1_i1:92-3919(+)
MAVDVVEQRVADLEQFCFDVLRAVHSGQATVPQRVAVALEALAAHHRAEGVPPQQPGRPPTVPAAAAGGAPSARSSVAGCSPSRSRPRRRSGCSGSVAEIAKSFSDGLGNEGRWREQRRRSRTPRSAVSPSREPSATPASSAPSVRSCHTMPPQDLQYETPPPPRGRRPAALRVWQPRPGGSARHSDPGCCYIPDPAGEPPEAQPGSHRRCCLAADSEEPRGTPGAGRAAAEASVRTEEMYQAGVMRVRSRRIMPEKTYDDPAAIEKCTFHPATLRPDCHRDPDEPPLWLRVGGAAGSRRRERVLSELVQEDNMRRCDYRVWRAANFRVLSPGSPTARSMGTSASPGTAQGLRSHRSTSPQEPRHQGHRVGSAVPPPVWIRGGGGSAPAPPPQPPTEARHQLPPPAEPALAPAANPLASQRQPPEGAAGSPDRGGGSSAAPAPQSTPAPASRSSGGGHPAGPALSPPGAGGDAREEAARPTANRAPESSAAGGAAPRGCRPPARVQLSLSPNHTRTSSGCSGASPHADTPSGHARSAAEPSVSPAPSFRYSSPAPSAMDAYRDMESPQGDRGGCDPAGQQQSKPSPAAAEQSASAVFGSALGEPQERRGRRDLAISDPAGLARGTSAALLTPTVPRDAVQPVSTAEVSRLLGRVRAHGSGGSGGAPRREDVVALRDALLARRSRSAESIGRRPRAGHTDLSELCATASLISEKRLLCAESEFGHEGLSPISSVASSRHHSLLAGLSGRYSRSQLWMSVMSGDAECAELFRQFVTCEERVRRAVSLGQMAAFKSIEADARDSQRALLKAAVRGSESESSSSLLGSDGGEGSSGSRGGSDSGSDSGKRCTMPQGKPVGSAAAAARPPPPPQQQQEQAAAPVASATASISATTSTSNSSSSSSSSSSKSSSRSGNASSNSTATKGRPAQPEPSAAAADVRSLASGESPELGKDVQPQQANDGDVGGGTAAARRGSLSSLASTLSQGWGGAGDEATAAVFKDEVKERLLLKQRALAERRELIDLKRQAAAVTLLAEWAKGTRQLITECDAEWERLALEQVADADATAERELILDELLAEVAAAEREESNERRNEEWEEGQARKDIRLACLAPLQAIDAAAIQIVVTAPVPPQLLKLQQEEDDRRDTVTCAEEVEFGDLMATAEDSAREVCALRRNSTGADSHGTPTQPGVLRRGSSGTSRAARHPAAELCTPPTAPLSAAAVPSSPAAGPCSLARTPSAGTSHFHSPELDGSVCDVEWTPQWRGALELAPPPLNPGGTK